MWCNISGEAAGKIWNWSLLGVKGLKELAWEAQTHKVVAFALKVTAIASLRASGGRALLLFWNCLTIKSRTQKNHHICSQQICSEINKRTIPCCSTCLIPGTRRRDGTSGTASKMHKQDFIINWQFYHCISAAVENAPLPGRGKFYQTSDGIVKSAPVPSEAVAVQWLPKRTVTRTGWSIDHLSRNCFRSLVEGRANLVFELLLQYN